MTLEFSRHHSFPSNHVLPRNIDIWLPPGYAVNDDWRFPVLYMHDGQNVFDQTEATNGIDWGVGQAMIRLIAAGNVEETIVVAIWNTSRRNQEYLPNQPFESVRGQGVLARLEPKYVPGPDADNYLRFLVDELKPYIDNNFRTRSDRKNTYMMGSSMGGMVSLYAICRYPQVFAGAGCLSTHWPAAEGIMIDYLADNLPDPASHHIYFDYGTETLDAQYETYQNRVNQIMHVAGFQHWDNWITLKFEGADHSENAWRKRVDVPLRFLLSKEVVWYDGKSRK